MESAKETGWKDRAILQVLDEHHQHEQPTPNRMFGSLQIVVRFDNRLNEALMRRGVVFGQPPILWIVPESAIGQPVR